MQWVLRALVGVVSGMEIAWRWRGGAEGMDHASKRLASPEPLTMLLLGPPGVRQILLRRLARRLDLRLVLQLHPGRTRCPSTNSGVGSPEQQSVSGRVLGPSGVGGVWRLLGNSPARPTRRTHCPRTSYCRFSAATSSRAFWSTSALICFRRTFSRCISRVHSSFSLRCCSAMYCCRSSSYCRFFFASASRRASCESHCKRDLREHAAQATQEPMT